MSLYSFGPSLSSVSLNGSPILIYETATIERMFLETLDESEFRVYSERTPLQALVAILTLSGPDRSEPDASGVP